MRSLTPLDKSAIDRILSELDTDERAYLEQRLRETEMYMGDDGEIVTLEELLDKSKRGR